MTPHTAGQGRIQAAGGPEAPEEGAATAARVQVTGVDEILDEIDSVIETNAAAFVQGFVQKGGQ
ncbi:ubiquitin-like protein Pup [Actinomyces bowdenii]|uniref:ubiquitin-like protein Pup n=1 Tax=Actinomyces bowdenii TaxID=131109 RepID=UPI00163A151A|nr:ubiquitin-like protein Pup [Actinomyces bowdenii]